MGACAKMSLGLFSKFLGRVKDCEMNDRIKTTITKSKSQDETSKSSELRSSFGIQHNDDGFRGSAERSTDILGSRSTFANFRATDLRHTVATRVIGVPQDEVEVWTKNLIEQYQAAAEQAPSGSLPETAAFARDLNFWKAFSISTVLGAVMGLTTLGFMNITDKIPRLWANGGPTTTTDDFFVCGDCNQLNGCYCDKYLNCQWYAGNIYWTIITTGTGFLVGLLRFLVGYPENMPGLLEEILHYRVNPQWAPYTIVISAISLAGGACLGPEQGLGNLGGGAATYLVENVFEFDDDAYPKIVVLSGMASALGALFPTPLLGVIMFHELGHPPRTFMETTLTLSAGACTAFLVYYSLVNESFTTSITSSGALVRIPVQIPHCSLICVCVALV